MIQLTWFEHRWINLHHWVNHWVSTVVFTNLGTVPPGARSLDLRRCHRPRGWALPRCAVAGRCLTWTRRSADRPRDGFFVIMVHRKITPLKTYYVTRFLFFWPSHPNVRFLVRPGLRSDVSWGVGTHGEGHSSMVWTLLEWTRCWTQTSTTTVSGWWLQYQASALRITEETQHIVDGVKSNHPNMQTSSQMILLIALNSWGCYQLVRNWLYRSI